MHVILKQREQVHGVTADHLSYIVRLAFTVVQVCPQKTNDQRK